MHLNRTSKWKVMTIWICQSFRCSILSVSIYCFSESDIRVKRYGRLNFPGAFIFNFEPLDIFYSWIEHPSEKLWPFEFLVSFRSSIPTVSRYYWPKSDIRVKRYGHLNLPCPSMFNFEHLDIFFSWIGHLSEMLWPLEFPDNFRCSISSVSIY